MLDILHGYLRGSFTSSNGTVRAWYTPPQFICLAMWPCRCLSTLPKSLWPQDGRLALPYIDLHEKATSRISSLISTARMATVRPLLVWGQTARSPARCITGSFKNAFIYPDCANTSPFPRSSELATMTSPVHGIFD